MLTLSAAVLCGAAWAAQDPPRQSPSAATRTVAAHEKPFGREGDPRKVARTIRIEIADAPHFSPSEVRVKRGQTVRFVVSNTGHSPHRFALGTHEGLKAQVARIRNGADRAQHPGFEVRPGQAVRFVWHFTRSGEFHYASLMPDQFDAGAVGTIIVR